MEGVESEGVEVWSLAKVVRPRVYQAEKEHLAQIEEDAKEEKRILRAAKKLEKEKAAKEKENR